jgi:hypothetical protein
MLAAARIDNDNCKIEVRRVCEVGALAGDLILWEDDRSMLQLTGRDTFHAMAYRGLRCDWNRQRRALLVPDAAFPPECRRFSLGDPFGPQSG